MADGMCEVPSMKVLTRGRMKEHLRGSVDDLSLLLAFQSLLRWPQTPCLSCHACHLSRVPLRTFFFNDLLDGLLLTTLEA